MFWYFFIEFAFILHFVFKFIVLYSFLFIAYIFKLFTLTIERNTTTFRSRHRKAVPTLQYHDHVKMFLLFFLSMSHHYNEKHMLTWSWATAFKNRSSFCWLRERGIIAQKRLSGGQKKMPDFQSFRLSSFLRRSANIANSSSVAYQSSESMHGAISR